MIEKNIRYVFLSKNIDIPRDLDSIIDRKYTNSVTGERFLILKNLFQKIKIAMIILFGLMFQSI